MLLKKNRTGHGNADNDADNDDEEEKKKEKEQVIKKPGKNKSRNKWMLRLTPQVQQLPSIEEASIEDNEGVTRKYSDGKESCNEELHPPTTLTHLLPSAEEGGKKDNESA